jgi:hypothetical protein
VSVCPVRQSFRRAKFGKWRSNLTISKKPGGSSGIQLTSAKRSRPANKKGGEGNLLTAFKVSFYFRFGGAGSAGLLVSCLPGKSAGFMLTSPDATSSYSGFGNL